LKRAFPLTPSLPNPDTPEPKVNGKTNNGTKKILSGNQELTKVKTDKIPDFSGSRF
jgi:hypothetical protein